MFATTYDYGTSSSISLVAGAGANTFFKKSKTPTHNISVGLGGGISGQVGFELGTDYYAADKKFDDYGRIFYGFDFSLLNSKLKIDSDILPSLFAQELSGARSLKWNYTTINDVLKQGGFSTETQGKAQIGVGLLEPIIDVNLSMAKKYELQENAINKLKKGIVFEGLKSETGKIMTKLGGVIDPTQKDNVKSVFEDFGNMETYLANNYDSNWRLGEVKITEQRQYIRGTDFSIAVPFKLALGIGVEGVVGAGIGAYSKANFPLSEKVYHPTVKDYLKTVDYPLTNAMVYLPKDPIAQMWDNIINTFVEYSKEIYDRAKDVVLGYLNTVKDKLGDTAVSFTNWVRKWSPFLRSPRPDVLLTRAVEDYSKLTFTVPNQDKAFLKGTDIQFSFYYPAGEVKGVLANKDTFNIISDIFFFEAFLNRDTLRKAPNGNFSIKAYLGKDDLDYWGMPVNTPVSIMYKSFQDTIWQVVSSVSRTQNDQIFQTDKTGIYAFGRIITKGDIIPPDINITNPTKFSGKDTLYVTITDDKSGVDWSSLKVLVNGQHLPYVRDGFSSRIKVLASKIPNLQPSELFFAVQCFDLAGNYKRQTISILTGTKELEVHQNLLKIYPNPTNSAINILWNTSNFEATEFVITDISGRVMNKQTEKPISDLQQTVFDVQHLSQGIYLLSIKQDGRILDTRKFIKL
jgi:hypothetical protein